MSTAVAPAVQGHPSQRMPLGWLALSSVVIPLAAISAFAMTISPWLGVVVAAVAAPLIWLVHRPVLVAALTAGIVPATSGIARGYPLPGLRISEVMVVVAAWVVLLLHSRNLPVSRWRWFDYLTLAFTSATAVFAAINAALGRWAPESAGIQISLGMLQFLLLYRVVVVGLWSPAGRQLGLRLLLVLSMPISVLAVLQQLVPNPFQSVAVAITQTGVFITPGYDPVSRATSVFAIWHALAGYLLVILLITLALLLAGDTRVLSRRTLLTVGGLGLAGMIATLTFTSYLGLALGAIILAWRFGYLVRVAVAGGAAVIVAVAAFWPLLSGRLDEQTLGPSVEQSIPFLPETLQYRVMVWIEQYAPVLPDSYAIGLGPSLPPSIDWSHTESAYITTTLRGGMVFLLLLILLQVGAAKLGWSAHARARLAADRATGAAAATVAIVLALINFVFPYITNGGLAQPAWVLWGLAAAVAARPLPGRPQAQAPIPVPAGASRAGSPAPAPSPPTGTAERTALIPPGAATAPPRRTP